MPEALFGVKAIRQHTSAKFASVLYVNIFDAHSIHGGKKTRITGDMSKASRFLFARTSGKLLNWTSNHIEYLL